MTDRHRTKLRTFEKLEYRRLQGIIRRVRNRWRLKVLLRGTALLLAAGLLTLGLAAWGAELFRMRPWIVGALSLLTYACIGTYLYRFVVRPLLRRADDRQVALYIEKHAPALRASLVSAVEFGAPEGRGSLGDVSPRFVDKVVEQALANGPVIEFGKVVERDALRRVSGYLGAASTAVLATLLINPAFLRQGMPLLFSPWGRAAGGAAYAVSVVPGDAEVARGGDQLITAALEGFDSDRVEISLKIGAGDWERIPMTAREDGGYSFMLLRLADAAEYFVEASGVRSPIHRLEVVDVPYVERIEMELVYPEYSGLSPELVEDGGDIAALSGTRARLRIHPTVAVPGGRIVVEIPGQGDGPAVSELPLELAGSVLEGEILVQEPGYYRVELERHDGSFAKASSEYVIDLLADQPPLVRLDAPGRDVSVTSIEEVFTEVSAEDDFGLSEMAIVYSLNGGEEQVVPLLAAGTVRADATGSHTFYLEEWELEPGDFVAYYARARDNRGPGAPQESASDIYFMNVRPFEREYRQADAGGGGGGGGGAQGFELSQRQRELVAATFKLRRDADALGSSQVDEDLDLLGGVQEELRDRTIAAADMVQRLQASGDLTAGLRALSAAADEMAAAAERLRAHDAPGALPPEQRALQQLQRFEALARELTVQQGGAGGGGGAGGMQGLEELFQIDPGELRNQYEEVQRGRREEADNEVDEALQRLTELARRQQQEIERQRAQARASGQPGGGGDAQRQIAEQAEELARQLERLGRSNSDRELQEAASRLQQAADAMRRAAAADQEGAAAESARALNEMQNARRLLDRERSGRLERDLAEAQQRMQRLQEAQDRMERQVAELSGGARSPEQMERILEGKDRIAEEIRELEHRLDDMARASRGDQLQTSRGLQEAAEFIRDAKLADKVRYSKGVVQERDTGYARRFEEQIGDDLSSLAEAIDDAAARLERPEGERLAGALDETRDLVRRLESFEERAREAQEAEQERRLGERPGEEEGSGRPGADPQSTGEGAAGQAGGEQGATGQQPGGQPGGAGNGPARRQLAREFQRRIDDAEALRESLADEGIQVTDLDGVIAAMRDLDEEFTGTRRGLDELRGEVIDGLKLFEFWLRRVTDAAGGREPRLSSSDAVPEGYRALVEEYFRSLARGDEGRGGVR